MKTCVRTDHNRLFIRLFTILTALFIVSCAEWSKEGTTEQAIKTCKKKNPGKGKHKGNVTCPQGPWGSGPGTPGTITEFAQNLPQVQGISTPPAVAATKKALRRQSHDGIGVSRSALTYCIPNDAGVGNVSNECISLTAPSIDYSELTETDIDMVLPTVPIFVKFNDDTGCPLSGAIAPAKLFRMRCSDALEELPAFDFAPGDYSFFGFPHLFDRMQVTLQNQTVTIIQGVTIKSTICGPGNAYIVSNGSSQLIEVSLTPGGDGNYTRNVYTTPYPSLSGITCANDGNVYFGTSKTWTNASFNAAYGANNASLLVERDPVRIVRFNTTNHTFTEIAQYTGGSRVISPGYTVLGFDEDEFGVRRDYYMFRGIANALTVASDGDLLFGDHVSGNVWKLNISDGSSTQLFTSPRLFTGLAQTPNGTIYLALNPKTSLANPCNADTVPPTIAYYNPNTGTVVDWLTLNAPDYPIVLQTLCDSGMYEQDFATGVEYLGGGNFNDIVSEPFHPNLFITESARNVTRAVEVTF